MEFLFWNQVASLEAIIVLLCVALICAIFLYDGYLFVARVLGILTPRKEYVKEKMAEEERREDSLARIEEEVAQISEEEFSGGENLTGDADETSIESENTPENILWEEVISTEEIIPSVEDEQIEKYLQEESAETIEDIYNEERDSIPQDIQEEIHAELYPDAEISEEEETISDATSLPVEEIIAEIEVSEEVIITPEAQEIVEEVVITVHEDSLPEILEEEPIETPDTSLLSDKESIEEISEEIVPDTIEVPTETEEEKVEENIQENENISETEEAIEESPEPIPYVRPTRVHEEIAEVPKKEAPQISPEKRDKLIEITNNTKTLIARGHIPEARALIIEWLSLHKNHRELNIMLGELYERDHGFEKAEFIYKDLAHTYPDDAEILMHLAGTLAMQRKYRISYELYKKILSLQGESEEILYTIAHLASELGETEETYEYARFYIKQYPKNPEILWLLSQSQVTLGKRKDAIETLIKLKNLTPYNQEIVDLIGKLVTEEEMAGNFGETNV